MDTEGTGKTSTGYTYADISYIPDRNEIDCGF